MLRETLIILLFSIVGLYCGSILEVKVDVEVEVEVYKRVAKNLVNYEVFLHGACPPPKSTEFH